MSIGNDRELQNTQHFQDMAFFQQQFDKTNNRFHDIEVSTTAIEAINKELAELHRNTVSSLPSRPLSLKVEALQLAKEIFNFVSQRSGAAPRFVMPSVTSDREANNRLWDQTQNNYLQLEQPYRAETQREWLVNYTARVSSVVGRLKDKGNTFERSCDLAERHPDVDFTYILCAQSIQEAAQKLPNN